MVVKKIDSDNLNFGQLKRAVEVSLAGGAGAVVVRGNSLMVTFVVEGEEIRELENEVLVVTEEENEADD